MSDPYRDPPPYPKREYVVWSGTGHSAMGDRDALSKFLNEHGAQGFRLVQLTSTHALTAVMERSP